MADLRVRAATADVTPTRPGELAGYAARGGALSTGTHDPLEATLLVLDDGETRIGWLALDAIGVPGLLAERLRAAALDGLGDPELSLVIAASHSHSAPLGWAGSIHPGHAGAVDPDAVDELVERVRVLASRVAGLDPVPVDASWSSGSARGLGTNRLDPSGANDERIGVLTLRDRQGRIRGVVLDATAHPTVLGPANLRWSADWPGAARAVLRTALATADAAADRNGQPPVVLFLQGASGDVSTRFTRRGDGFDEVARLGTLAAGAALTAIAGESAAVEGPIRHLRRVVELDRRPLPPADAAERELVLATAEREELRALPELDPRVRLAQARLDGAVVQRGLLDSAPGGRVAMPVSVTAIGDVAWAHVPVELFASVGERVRAASPFPVTRVVGYADDYRGYLVDQSAAEAGSYEALSTFFPVSAGDELVAALQSLLEELR